MLTGILTLHHGLLTFRLQCGIKKVEGGGGAAAPLNSKTGGGCVRSLEAGKHTKG